MRIWPGVCANSTACTRSRSIKLAKRVGHVFQGRYKAILVQKEAYLLELARYVVLNPVRARMVPVPGQWLWSSYRATIGAESTPEWPDARQILAAFGDTEEQAVDRYVGFVADGVREPSPRSQRKHQVFLGSDVFVESMRRKVPAGRDLREIPRLGHGRLRSRSSTLPASMPSGTTPLWRPMRAVATACRHRRLLTPPLLARRQGCPGGKLASISTDHS
jgi:hypothetical protein